MKAKVVACIIARTVSTRLPLKVLRSVGGENTMLEFLIKRLKMSSAIDEIFICTSVEAVDEILEDIAHRSGVSIFRGSPENVIERMLNVGRITTADILLRITGDNPLTSFEFINEQVAFLRRENLDYVRLIDVPVGATAEVMRYDALSKCASTMDPSVSEYLMLFMFEPRHFRCGVIRPFEKDYSNISLTIDTPQDFARTKEIFLRLNGDRVSVKLVDILGVIESDHIPGSYIQPSGQIKMPYGKVIEFEDFLKDMQRRISDSKLLNLYE